MKSKKCAKRGNSIATGRPETYGEIARTQAAGNAQAAD